MFTVVYCFLSDFSGKISGMKNAMKLINIYSFIGSTYDLRFLVIYALDNVAGENSNSLMVDQNELS